MTDETRFRLASDDTAEILRAVAEHGVIDLVTQGRLYKGFRLDSVQLHGDDGPATIKPFSAHLWDCQGDEEPRGTSIIRPLYAEWNKGDQGSGPPPPGAGG